MFWVSFWSKSEACGGTKSKTKHPSWLYCTVLRLSGAATRGALQKKLFLKILQYPHETPVLESLFKKFTSLKVCNIIRKRTQHRCFPVNTAKLKRLPILKNSCLLTVLMVHCYMGLKFQGLYLMMVSGFRVQVFCF